MSLIKEKFDAVVKELNFDTSDPFTKMLAMAFAGIEAHDELKRAHADALERVSALEDRERTFRALIADDDYCANINSADELRKDLLGWIDEENAIDPKGPPDYRSVGGQS